MDKFDRFLNLLKIEGVSMAELAEKSGTKRHRWSDIKNHKAKIRMEDFEVLSQVFPEYEVWLMTGREYPDDGQISPMTKLLQK